MFLKTQPGPGGKLLALVAVAIWGCTTEHVLPNTTGGGGGSTSAGVGGRGENGSGAVGQGGTIAGDHSGMAGARDDGGSGDTTEGGVTSANEGGGGGAAGDAGSCTVNIQAKTAIPTVLLLVDTSSSMFEPRASSWDALYNMLMKPTDGIVASLQGKVRFGFTSYRGLSTGDDRACPNLLEVDYELDNFAAIDTAYKARGAEYMQGVKWTTPTGAAIRKVAEKLAAYVADPPGAKYILLVTDGNPDTCTVTDPKCGSDESIKAVQDAKAMGISTFAVGIGDIVANNTGCELAWGRCGSLHLQDLANAGQGLPVQAPPDALRYQPCTPTQMLSATYAGTSTTPGTAPFYTATTAAELETALKSTLNPLASCTYDLNVTVVGDPASGTVAVNGVPRTYDDPNGWRLEASKGSITLQGASCDALKEPNSTLSIGFPCDVAMAK